MSFYAFRSKTTARMTRWQSSKLESSKQSPLRAWNVLQRLRLVLSEAGKRCDSATGPEDLRCGGRSFGTCFDEILPDLERRDQKSVFFGPPLSGRHRQTRMQKRLSARRKALDRAEDMIQD